MSPGQAICHHGPVRASGTLSLRDHVDNCWVISGPAAGRCQTLPLLLSSAHPLPTSVSVDPAGVSHGSPAEGALVVVHGRRAEGGLRAAFYCSADGRPTPRRASAVIGAGVRPRGATYGTAGRPPGTARHAQAGSAVRAH